MTHLAEAQLNEYLDGAIPAEGREQVEAHLAGCASCRAELAALQEVLDTLKALPEETPSRDLLPVLPGQTADLAWKLAASLQAGLALGLLILAAPFLSSRLAALVICAPIRIKLPVPALPGPGQLPTLLPALHLPPLTLPPLPRHTLPGNPSAWMLLGAASGLLFVVGNLSLVFLRRPEVRE